MTDRPRILACTFACCPPNKPGFAGGEDVLGWNLLGQIAKHNDVWALTTTQNKTGIEEAIAEGLISNVSFEKTEYNELPHKFEAGTPNIAGGIGFGAAIDYINELGYENIRSYETELVNYAVKALQNIDGLRFIGTPEERAGVISFVMEGLHPYDVGTILDQQGIAVRTGHHCTQPLMDKFKIQGTIRVSFSIYNTKEEVDLLIKGIEKAKKMLS